MRGGNKMKFTVYAEPVAKGRPRFSGYHAYTPKKTRDYEKLVRDSYIQECGETFLEGEIRANIICYFPIPKSTSKKNRALMERGDIRHTKRSDCDNLAKTILDALNGIAYKDDCQVCELHVYKFYSSEPRTEVILSSKE